MSNEHLFEESKALHAKYKGKIAIQSKIPLETANDLSLAYTPGVAQPCLEIHQEQEKVYTYTSKGNTVAVITDGTAVLGLGDIGPYASLPVMEGKALLFKKFADIDAIPIAIKTKDPEEFINIVSKICASFGGVNLEDISAPRCFEIEDRLKEKLDIPVFHDDQHGTAIVVLAALINALQLVGKRFEDVTIVINGAGAAGMAIVKLLRPYNVGDILLCDTSGIIYEGRGENMSAHKDRKAKKTNKTKKMGDLAEAMKGADIFIGVSKAKMVTQDMVRSMAKDPIILALANPTPEILPHEALAAGAAIVCTGRSDFPNQVNNALAFPGIFRGALDVRAREINDSMKHAAAEVLASLVSKSELSPQYIIPKLFDPRVVAAVSKAVAQAARETGACARP